MADFRKPDRYKASSYRAYNDKFPGKYDSSIWMRFCQVARWDRAIVDELGSGIGTAAILDVGCATGRLLLALANAGARQLCGVDLAPNIVAVAREKLARQSVPVELRVADTEDELPWPAGSFDVVVLTGVLHHLFRPADALREIHRVLRPQGRLVVLDPEFVPVMRQVINACLRIGPHDGDCCFYSARQSAALLERAGFQCTGTSRVGLWAYLVRGIKQAERAGDFETGVSAT